MILTFDIGNTDTVLGIFEGPKLAVHCRLSTHPERTADEYGLLLRSILRESAVEPGDVRGAALASVVPTLTHALQEACRRHMGVDPLVLDPASPGPVTLDVEEPLNVGADRIANTLAAARLYERDTITVDLGTATTFDCITADATFKGGIIAPGVRTGAATLTRKTAKLPSVDIEPPPTVVGRRTDTALQSGIFYGAVESIDGIVRRIRAEWEADALVVSTGGLAASLAPHSATIEKVEPFLTLHGLRLALEAAG